MSTKPLLRVSDLSLRFETREQNTLSGINFELDKGESLLLLGPSGCGKSTLTFCLNGLYPRELDGELGGEIFFHGKKTTAFQPGELSRYVGVVFQDPETQFCMLTVEDEIAFGLENINTPREKIGEKIEDALKLVNLHEFRNTEVATLSGGQKQKLALACILAMEPDLLILDEPTANLDPVASKDLMRTIQNLKLQQDFTLIVIEHQLDGWMEFMDRSLLLNRNGEVFYDGSLRAGVKAILPSLYEQGIWLPRITQYALAHNPESIPLTMDEVSSNWISFERQKIPDKRKREVFLKASNLSWQKRKRKIIEDISLEIHEGEFIAIAGANGSGKTSLSKILAGIQKPSTGNIMLKNKPLEKWNEADLRREIGYVFQNPEHQFVTDTVYEEVAFSLRIKEAADEVIQKSVTDILGVCGLTGLENEHPYALSQGQKRRLSVATMIVDDQKMLILDEPTFGQDAHSTGELMDLLEERNRQDTTIVMITHDMEIIHHYADRVIVLDQGRVAADCHPLELWQQPESTLQGWQLELPVEVQLQHLSERNAEYVSASP
ncbi:ABC transporter ATP-binding protein [Virgibacillus kekensis]|uniref:ABC transporter ATP-binding protein n=1 Tax=Virgibacillus kekensis TaxID=202261 RepID=A0ABV9DHN0_9BACI